MPCAEHHGARTDGRNYLAMHQGPDPHLDARPLECGRGSYQGPTAIKTIVVAAHKTKPEKQTGRPRHWGLAIAPTLCLFPAIFHRTLFAELLADSKNAELEQLYSHDPFQPASSSFKSSCSSS